MSRLMVFSSSAAREPSGRNGVYVLQTENRTIFTFHGIDHGKSCCSVTVPIFSRSCSLSCCGTVLLQTSWTMGRTCDVACRQQGGPSSEGPSAPPAPRAATPEPRGTCQSFPSTEKKTQKFLCVSRQVHHHHRKNVFAITLLKS